MSAPDSEDRLRAAEERLRELEEEARALQVLNRTGMAVASNLDLEEVVQAVTDAGVELSGAQFGAFFYNVIDEKGEAYTLYTLSGSRARLFPAFPCRATRRCLIPPSRARPSCARAR